MRLFGLQKGHFSYGFCLGFQLWPSNIGLFLNPERPQEGSQFQSLMFVVVRCSRPSTISAKNIVEECGRDMDENSINRGDRVATWFWDSCKSFCRSDYRMVLELCHCVHPDAGIEWWLGGWFSSMRFRDFTAMGPCVVWTMLRMWKGPEVSLS